MKSEHHKRLNELLDQFSVNCRRALNAYSRFLDPDCPYAVKMRTLQIPGEITPEDERRFDEFLKERHPGKEIEKPHVRQPTAYKEQDQQT